MDQRGRAHEQARTPWASWGGETDSLDVPDLTARAGRGEARWEWEWEDAVCRIRGGQGDGDAIEPNTAQHNATHGGLAGGGDGGRRDVEEEEAGIAE